MASALPSRHNRDFVNRVQVGKNASDERVPGFVVGGNLLLPLSDDPAPTLRAGDYPVDRSSSSAMLMFCLFRRAARIAASFITFSRSAPEKPGVDLATRSRSTEESKGFDLLWTFRVCETTIPIRQVQGYPPVEASRTEQSLIQVISGRLVAAIHDDIVMLIETIHLHQYLVQCLLSLVIAPPETGATYFRPTASISSTKTMQGAFCLACSKGFSPRGANTYEHLHELRTAYGKEGHPSLASCTARASRVFPVPGGRTIRTPLGFWPPRRRTSTVI